MTSQLKNEQIVQIQNNTYHHCWSVPFLKELKTYTINLRYKLIDEIIMR